MKKFNPERRDPKIWVERKITEPHRLLYAGRVSVEKNLPLLADAFSLLCGKRRDAALIIAGEGPHLAEMKQRLASVSEVMMDEWSRTKKAPHHADWVHKK